MFLSHALSLGFIRPHRTFPLHSPQFLHRWWLRVRRQSIATIKCCSGVLKPLAVCQWIILPATYQQTFPILIFPHSWRFRLFFHSRQEELKSIFSTNCYKQRSKVQPASVTQCQLNFPPPGQNDLDMISLLSDKCDHNLLQSQTIAIK